MLLFVKQYKQEVLGVGEVALPGESAALKEAVLLRTVKESGQQQGHTSASAAAAAAAEGSNGTDGMTEYVSGDESLWNIQQLLFGEKVRNSKCIYDPPLCEDTDSHHNYQQ